ncbi:SseB family protein [Angustibacter sp. McL0619]|uniref:SseB family protein n=1 Tax=Angustibacter sp. McL0619 TaxID=3415676 RepID=UPI003CEC9D44
MDQGPTDSAGLPWQGRTLPGGGFDGDDGGADPVVTQALAALGEGSGSVAAVVRELAASRLLVPVVAVLGEGVEASHGPADKSADMALVTLTGNDGRRALPVFSSLESLARWDPSARPVPVPCRRAAVSAVAEGCELMVLDPAGPVTFVVSRPALWAIGQGRPWTPAHQDREIATVLGEVAEQVPGVVGLRSEPGTDAELLVVLLLAPGLADDVVRGAAATVAERLQASELLRERVDGIRLSLAPAG